MVDIYVFNEYDKIEFLLLGRILDYNESICFKIGSKFYFNLSEVMFEIIEDKVEDYDFLFMLCSVDIFRYFYFDEEFVFGCYGNFVVVFVEFDIFVYYVGIMFNIFMNVDISDNGKIVVLLLKS